MRIHAHMRACLFLFLFAAPLESRAHDEGAPRQIGEVRPLSEFRNRIGGVRVLADNPGDHPCVRFSWFPMNCTLYGCYRALTQRNTTDAFIVCWSKILHNAEHEAFYSSCMGVVYQFDS